jgi:predicted transcriptional regulator
VTLGDVQMRPLITIDSDQDAEEARRLMDEHGLNRLVVVDDDELAGIVSEADLRSDEGPAAYPPSASTSTPCKPLPN